MAVSVYHVDAFTRSPFSGNPAAVCILYGPGDEIWMQSIAAEMNLSETAFVYPKQTGFGLRWFTPTTEVDLCGHATLATAHILWESRLLDPTQQAEFHTKSGLLTATRSDTWIEMNLPSTTDVESPAPPGLSAALGVDPLYVGTCGILMIVEVGTEEVVSRMHPDFGLLARIDVAGVIVTARSSSGEFDFVSRFFAPRLGIPEDPVTGAAHCCLGPFWRKRLGKDAFTAYQASSRGGIIRVRVAGERTLLSGQAVTVLSGIIL